jgi:uncharacterized protein YodC (DUF2158 family)
MEVFRPGTEVLLKNELPAIVVGVSIYSDDTIQYQCAWWNGRSRNKDWIKPCEIVSAVNSSSKMKIGFKGG